MNDSFPKTHLESLWAPWRVEYFQAEHQAGTDFLSEAAQTDDDAASPRCDPAKIHISPDEQVSVLRPVISWQ